MTRPKDVVIVGGGHNALVAGCYLRKAGVEVLILEQSDGLGGGSRTEETVPGYLFDTHSAAHNIINMTDIPQELELAEAGLRYVEMDPFATAIFAGGPIIRFHRDIAATVASIREVDPVEAESYAQFMQLAVPLVTAAMSGIEAGASAARVRRMLPGRLVAAGQALLRNGGPSGIIRQVLAPYQRLLTEHLASDLTRAPVAAFAAHAGASPAQAGTAFYGLWQAAYHRFGQWHAIGGAQGLVDALEVRFTSLGGQVRTSAGVARILTKANTVQGVVLDDGERIPARVVMTAINPQTALFDLLDPPLDGPEAKDLRGVHLGNAVQMLVHVATDKLPPYPGARPGDHAGLQSYVDRLDDLVAGFAAADAHLLPRDPVPTYSFTTSALDDTLAPPGHHTVYLACPSAPFDLHGGWPAQAEAFAQRMIDTVEARAPGFRDSIQGMSIRTPPDMAAQLRWPGAHPMGIDISLDQLAWMRPTLGLAGHATPVRGLFITGAGTAPMGGVAGTPGRAAAKAVLARHGAPGR